MRLIFDIFRKNKLGSLALLYIVCIGIIAVFCYQIAPDNTENANFMHLEIHSKSPGFECYILDFDSTKLETDKVFENNGITLLVDEKSYLYLMGTTLNYSGGLNGKGFVFENPNASRTCGCGESFAL